MGRVWFTMKNNNTKWKKTNPKKTIEWVGKDEKSLKKFETAFEAQIGKKTSFKKCIDKIKYTVNHTLRKKKKISNKLILAAVWMDEELRNSIKLRSFYSKQFNIAKKNKNLPDRTADYKMKYLKQKRITKTMCSNNKSQWEDKKISETWNDGKNFWKILIFLS